MTFLVRSPALTVTVASLELPVLLVAVTVMVPPETLAVHHEALLDTVTVEFDDTLAVFVPPSTLKDNSVGFTPSVTPSCDILIVLVSSPALIVTVPSRGEDDEAALALTVIVELPVPEVGFTESQLTGLQLAVHLVFEEIVTVVVD